MKKPIYLDNICTMGTGRWYEIPSSKERFFISEDEVCSIIDERHADDPSYEDAWDASKEEYEAVYDELSSLVAMELM